jgi:hypothetical protein
MQPDLQIKPPTTSYSSRSSFLQRRRDQKDLLCRCTFTPRSASSSDAEVCVKPSINQPVVAVPVDAFQACSPKSRHGSLVRPSYWAGLKPLDCSASRLCHSRQRRGGLDLCGWYFTPSRHRSRMLMVGVRMLKTKIKRITIAVFPRSNALTRSRRVLQALAITICSIWPTSSKPSPVRRSAIWHSSKWHGAISAFEGSATRRT